MLVDLPGMDIVDAFDTPKTLQSWPHLISNLCFSLSKGYHGALQCDEFESVYELLSSSLY